MLTYLRKDSKLFWFDFLPKTFMFSIIKKVVTKNYFNSLRKLSTKMEASKLVWMDMEMTGR